MSDKHRHPLLMVDAVVFGLAPGGAEAGALQILVIRRRKPPLEDRWALPGGHVDMDESLDEAVRRELREETGLDVARLEQFHTFGAVGRDPRDRVVTVAYFGLVRLSDYKVKASTDAKAAEWVPVGRLAEKDLAFDHPAIVRMAQDRLREKVRRQPIGFDLLPRQFSLSEMQRLYQVVLERELDKRNFRKKVQSLGILTAAGAQTGVAHRAARLYRFDVKKYRQATRDGFDFDI